MLIQQYSYIFRIHFIKSKDASNHNFTENSVDGSNKITKIICVFMQTILPDCFYAKYFFFY